MDVVYGLGVFCTTSLAAWGTYWLHHRYANINPILASASLSLLVALICQHHSSSVLMNNIPYVFIGGSFIGMSTRKKIKSTINLLLASLLFSLIYLKSSQLFQGFGGALGLSACISVLIVITSTKIFVRSKHYIKKRKHL